MLRIGSVVVRCRDLARLEAFWTEALDYVPAEASRDVDFVILRPRHGTGPNLSLDEHHAERVLPPRIHLDLYADDQDAEVERLVGLGARRVDWDRRPPDADYVILEDPEGNRFCVIAGG
jgi:catechol 2,3-dioxygenase-like lactoylglutathione lyase family enzyme